MDSLLQNIHDVNLHIAKQEIAVFANEKMGWYGILDKGWTFGWDNCKKSLGMCRIKEKKITLSLFLLNTVTPEDRKDTVLHEIAHALDVEDRGYSDHGPKWKHWARYVGAKPVRCSKQPEATEYAKVMKQAKWTLRCPNGHESHFHRKLKGRHSCLVCDPRPRFNEQFLLEAIQNY